MPEPRPPLTRESLAALVAAAGLRLAPDELDALVRPTAATYAAVDSLDALALGETEPAGVFHLPRE